MYLMMNDRLFVNNGNKIIIDIEIGIVSCPSQSLHLRVMPVID